MLLIDNGADVDTARWQSASSPLLESVKQCGSKCVQLILDKGVDINARVAGYSSALEACVIGREDMVQLLLDNGAISKPDTLLAALRDGKEHVLHYSLIAQACGRMDCSEKNRIGE